MLKNPDFIKCRVKSPYQQFLILLKFMNSHYPLPKGVSHCDV